MQRTIIKPSSQLRAGILFGFWVTDFSARTDEDRRQRYWAAWREYSAALTAAGVTRNGAALQAGGTGTTVRMNGNARHVQDGPYADTKEQLGGFMLIDVPDLDAALDWAARCPAATYGAVEVRPVFEGGIG